MIEYFLEGILCYIPFYWELKIVFILWLQLPQTLGASFLFKNYLEPFLKRNQDRIDQTTKELISEGISEVETLGMEGLKSLTKTVTQNEEAKKVMGNVVNTVVDTVVQNEKDRVLKKTE